MASSDHDPSSPRSAVGSITEIAPAYPNRDRVPPAKRGSTHEITFHPGEPELLWISAPTYDVVATIAVASGEVAFYPMAEGSAPHGMAFDAKGRLWVALEDFGKIVELDRQGKIVKEYDVNLECTTSRKAILTHPHGLSAGPDGETLWFACKATGTVGRITPDGKVETIALHTVGSVPIYIKPGPDGNMWATELVGNAIARITPDGEVTDFPIPTANSRPIAIVPEPGGAAMWFSEEAGNKVARIDMDGKITEFPVPMTQPNVILAGLAFDGEGNLWTQQYVDQSRPLPAGPDHLVRIDKAILTAPPGDVSGIVFTYYQVPTRNTGMHRIIEGPDRNMWFTELKADRVGRAISGLASG
jgi:virginiamycin B lyase